MWRYCNIHTVFKKCLNELKHLIKSTYCFVVSQIRRQMIDGKPGQKKIKTLVKSVDKVRYLHILQADMFH